MSQRRPPARARAQARGRSCRTKTRRTKRERVRRGRRRRTRARSQPFLSRRSVSTNGAGIVPAPSLYGVIKSKESSGETGVGERTLSMARVDLVRSGAQRVALAATGIVAALYVLIAVGVVLIVTHNLTSNVDSTLSSWLTSMAKARGGPTRGYPGPPVAQRFDAPVLWWTFHPDGNYADSSAEAATINLPAPYNRIQAPQTITVSGVDLRVMGGQTSDDWTVVGQSMNSVYQARGNLIEAELLIGPVLLLVVFLGALTIGRRVASPIERARQRQMDFTANASHEWLDHLVGVLLDNACKYTPEQGTIEVRVAAEANRIKLAVDDSGPGIPADQRGQIFDRFRRASDLPGGSGLGLAIADAVVSATNGRWEVGSSATGGASMAVIWPRLLARPSATRASSSETTPPLARLDA